MASVDAVGRCLLAIAFSAFLNSQPGDACGPNRKASVNELKKFVQFENWRGSEGLANAQTLSCTFDDGDTCAWYDDENAPLHWQKTRFKQQVTPNQMKDVTGRTDLPNNEFLAAGSEIARAPTDSANLIADVPCLDQNSKLTMRYWKSSDNTQLEVCTACPDQQEPVCVAAPQSRIYPHPIDFTVGCNGPTKGPAKLIIRASNYKQPDFVAIDDLTFEGSLCQGDIGPGTPRPGVPTGSTPGRLPNGCSTLTCDFERGNTCGWRPGSFESGQWNVNSGREGSPLTGIYGDSVGNKDGKYAFVGRTEPNVASSSTDAGGTYVLQSPVFKTSVPTKLKYRLFDRSVGPIFEVCLDPALTDCRNRVEGPQPGEAATAKWRDEQTVDLEPNRPYQISFVAKNLKANYYIGLDDVKLEPSNGDSNACTGA